MRYALILLLVPALAQADTIVRAPGVYVEVGPAIVVRAPFVHIVIPRTKPVPLPAPVPVPLPPPKGVVPIDPSGPPPVPGEELPPLPAPKPVAVKVPTVREFASREFDAGRHEAIVLHPMTGKPVKVAFTLPVSPRRVFVERDRIEFRWGVLARKGVSLVFRRDGGVELE